MIGECIRKLRQRKGMVQAALAERICSRSHVGAVEEGKYVPTVELLNELCTALDTPIVQLVGFYLEALPSIPQVFALARKLALMEDTKMATYVFQHALKRVNRELDNHRFKAEVLETEGIISYAEPA